MRVGVPLPIFRGDAEEALAVAHRAAEMGLDGVFAYDHLFSFDTMRGALSPTVVLAAVAAREPSLVVGTLVSRVGVRSRAELRDALETLLDAAPGRCVIGLGLGDETARREADQLGRPWPARAQRLDELATLVESFAARTEVWVAGTREDVVALARARGLTRNLWEASEGEVASAALDGPVTWAGVAPPTPGPHLDALAAAGARWAVCATRGVLADLAAWREKDSQKKS